MSHLPSERLAALVDDSPTATEHAHLAACAECAEELNAHRELVAIAKLERASIGLPLTRWESLSVALRDEGLLTTPAARSATARSDRGGNAWRQAAAALLLTTGGIAVGRYTAGATLRPNGSSVPVAQTGQTTPAAQTTATASLASTTFHSMAEARQASKDAEMLYQNAAAYLAGHDSVSRGTESPSAMRTRLAALDRVSHTIRQALDDAPYDPVINGYYLTTLGQRQATLQQLNTALPVGLRMKNY